MEIIYNKEWIKPIWINKEKTFQGAIEDCKVNWEFIWKNLIDELKYYKKKENFYNKYSKGLIVIGYQGIGKTSIAGKEKCIDFESSNFWINGKKDKNWALIYAKQALDIANQGYTVLTSSHKEVREAFKSLPLPENVGKIVIFCPDFRHKNEWIDRLQNRYHNDPSEKNLRALQNAMTYFDENIFDLDNNGYFPVYNPAYTPDYDLMDYIHKIRIDWCKNDKCVN